MIRGRNIELRALERESGETLRAWANEPEVNRWMQTGRIPLTAEQELAFIDRMGSSDHDQVFQIHLAETGALIGVIGLHAIDWIDRHGEIGIFIGDIAQQDRGNGRDAITTLLRHAFDTLGLHTVRILAVDGNERGLGLYQSIGFQHRGTFRSNTFLRGQWHDMHLLDMLDSEYRARYGTAG